MDIYTYFNSSDIANYCKSIGHKFNTIEMAYIIDKSDTSIKQKNIAFQELINSYPNMPFHKSVNFKGGSNIHDYLRELIKYRETMLKLFENPNNTSKTFYTISKLSAHTMGLSYKEKEIYFSSLDELWDFLYPHMVKNDIKEICILRGMTKKRLDRIPIIYNRNREAVWIHNEYYLNPKYELANITPEGPGSLSSLFIHIPIPFKEGDLISIDDAPCVLKSIPHFAKNYNELETGMMQPPCPFSDRPEFAVYYYLNKNGTLKDSFPDSHRVRFPGNKGGFGMHVDKLKYYSKPLKEEEKVLLELSNHIKKKAE